VMAQASDFTPGAWAIVQGLPKGKTGTVSSLSDGRAIHKGFMVGKRGSIVGGGSNGGPGFMDGFDEVTRTIFELKPNNLNGLMTGINQLSRYNIAKGGGFRLILVLY